MTIFEKGGWALLLLVFAVSGGDLGFLRLGLYALMGMYAVGGYWLFRLPPIPAAWLRIGVGLCLAATLYALDQSIMLHRSALQQGLPALSGGLAVGLGLYGLRYRQEAAEKVSWRPLFWRAAVLFVVTAFFAYTPITFAPFRAGLIALHPAQTPLAHNLRMFDFVQTAEEALDAKDGPAAVRAARFAYTAGTLWLGADSLTDRQKISGVYTTLFKAYACRADAAYDQGHYAEALRDYSRGHEVLVRGDHRKEGEDAPSTYWEIEKAWSLQDLAYCHLKLGHVAPSDSLFALALSTYQQQRPTPDLGTARLLSSLAEAQAAHAHPDLSTRLYRNANHIFAQTGTPEAKSDLLNNRLLIAYNYLHQDSLDQAGHELRTLPLATMDSARRAVAYLYEGMCRYKQSRYPEAEQHFTAGLRYFQAHPATASSQVFASQMLLAHVRLALADYPKARAYARAAQTFWAQTRPSSDQAGPEAECLAVLAAISNALGQYEEATQQYERVQDHYTQQARVTGKGGRLANILAEVAALRLTKDDLMGSEESITTAISLLEDSGRVRLPSQTGLLTTAAHVDYAAGRHASARSKYQLAIRVNRRHGMLHSPVTAAAWNGLGLLALEQGRLAQADSLLAAATDVYEQVLGRRHPVTATVYLNHARLRAKQGRVAEAHTLVAQAQQAAAATLPADHDLWGDVAAARADLARQQGQPAMAREYYRQAQSIYTRKFGARHWKAEQMRLEQVTGLGS